MIKIQSFFQKFSFLGYMLIKIFLSSQSQLNIFVWKIETFHTFSIMVNQTHSFNSLHHIMSVFFFLFSFVEFETCSYRETNK